MRAAGFLALGALVFAVLGLVGADVGGLTALREVAIAAGLAALAVLMLKGRV